MDHKGGWQQWEFARVLQVACASQVKALPAGITCFLGTQGRTPNLNLEIKVTVGIWGLQKILGFLLRIFIRLNSTGTSCMA